MEQSTDSAAGSFTDIPSSTMLDGLKIMEALSNEDAVNLFFYAEKGIASSTEAIRALGMTQKRYYTRLKLLLDAGLIQKTEEGYQHTLLGKLVHKLGFSLLGLVEKKKQLAVMDTIQKDKSISNEEARQIAKTLSIEIPLLDITGKVKMVDSYKALIEELLKMIKNCNETLYIASKYPDVQIVEETLKARERGVKMFFLAEKNILKDSLSMFRILLSPSMIKAFSKLMKDLRSLLRQVSELTYSFIIVDDRISVIEVPHPKHDSFYLAFIFENNKISKKMGQIFIDMWKNADLFKLL